MTIATRLTERFGITHPIIGAPMALAGGGALAGAVSAAGGLGLIGGGYCDGDWIEQQFKVAGNQPVGCGFITWALRKSPQVFDAVLAHLPKCVFLSFDDPEPFVAMSHAQGIPVLCQVQTVRDAKRAIDVGAEVIVAQGAEAGGHGAGRATITLVPEIADLIASRSPETLLCAAGGIADGRGLAAALMLGADGAVIGSRFWASSEALVHPNMHRAALAASGDDTIRSSVGDIVRALAWPAPFTLRTLKNSFTGEWHGREAELRRSAQVESKRFREAAQVGDASVANTVVGEAVGLICAIEPAGEILARMVADAELALKEGAARVRH